MLCVSIAAELSALIHVGEMAGLLLCLMSCAGYNFRMTSRRLIDSADILRYWRRFGQPPSDEHEKTDPYNLEIPVTCFRSRTNANTHLFRTSIASRGLRATEFINKLKPG